MNAAPLTDAGVTDDRSGTHSGAVNQSLSAVQLQKLRDRMQANRQPVDRHPWSRHEFPRGWNEAFVHVDKWIKEIVGEKAA